MRASRGLPSIAVILLAVGCTGVIAGPSQPPDPLPCDGTCEASPWLPARIRRLTNAEFDTTVAALLQTDKRHGATFPSETRQGVFTRNDAVVVDSVFARALDEAATALADEAVANKLDVLVPCAAQGPTEVCADQFVDGFATRAFRRPLTESERSGLRSVYQVGAEESFSAGIALIIRAVLQSPSFLYVTELGDTLNPYEIATQLSYLFSGGPPDDALWEAAAAGTLSVPSVREEHARRLLQLPGARAQLKTLVVEWLGLDALKSLDKDPALYPNFAALKPHMLSESEALVEEVFFAESGGTVSALLEADYTLASPELAAAYGLSGSGRVSLAGTSRRGILSLSAFLSAHSNTTDSGPIRRGVALLRRVLCVHITNPGELNINVVPPPPNPALTTRERFLQHSVNASCQGCHRMIDPVGFAFEQFDASGLYRTEENGRPIDTQGELMVSDGAGRFAGSQELIARISHSEETRTCFARQIFRFSSARTDANEEMLLDLVPQDRRGDPVEVLVAYAKSDFFIRRDTRSSP